MLIEILLCAYILCYTRLYLPTKLLLILLILYVLQDIRNAIDLRSSTPITANTLKESLPPGTVITYSYRNLLHSTTLDFLIPYRLFANRYVHTALVVEKEGEPHVLEWRYFSKSGVNHIKKLPFGFIALTPLQDFIENVGSVIYSIFTPPPSLSSNPITYNPKLIDEITTRNPYLCCTYFTTSYLKLETGNIPYPFLFTPNSCQSLLRNHGYKQQYLHYSK